MLRSVSHLGLPCKVSRRPTWLSRRYISQIWMLQSRRFSKEAQPTKPPAEVAQSETRFPALLEIFAGKHDALSRLLHRIDENEVMRQLSGLYKEPFVYVKTKGKKYYLRDLKGESKASRYRIIRKIGSGETSSVWLALNPK